MSQPAHVMKAARIRANTPNIRSFMIPYPIREHGADRPDCVRTVGKMRGGGACRRPRDRFTS
ncbi:Uncharacterised protein [Bordetella pertussis]|nr:Uncharacterised protein [Bordetella pertussis]